MVLKVLKENLKMKKLLLFILFLIPGACIAQEIMLQGGVVEKIKVDQARQVAFENLPLQVNTSDYPPLDPDRVINLQAKVQHQICLPDRRVDTLSDGVYRIAFFGNFYGIYYNPDGSSLKIDILTKPFVPNPYMMPNRYPIRRAQYRYPSGKLLNTGISVSPTEDYYFHPTGQLDFYCLGNACYSANGALRAYRTTHEVCTQTEVQIPSGVPPAQPAY